MLNKAKSAIYTFSVQWPEGVVLFAENFCKNSDLNKSGMYLPTFPFFSQLIWNCIIFLTPKMIKHIITSFDLLMASSPDGILVVVLYYILAELFNMCQKESCFPDCWKVSYVALVLRMLWKGLLGKKTTAQLVSFMWLVKSL